MRILVTGGTGVVGWEILSRAPEEVQFSYTYLDNPVEHPAADGYELDIRDPAAVQELITSLDPDVVIHAAAMTDVDYCELHPDAGHAVNVEGTANVIDAAESVDAHLVFLSTSFVFDGSRSEYVESDARDPINEYGRTKARAERLVEAASINSAIVRTDQPYGWSQPWQSDTMVEWVLDAVREESGLQVFEDWYNTPTYLPELAEFLLKTAREEREGIYHAAGPDYVSRYEWAIQVCETFGHDAALISPSASSSVDLAATRPNTMLKNVVAKEQSNVEFSGVKSGAREMYDAASR